MKNLTSPASLSAILLAAFCSPAIAVSLVLHNTGEGLSEGDPDPNWSVVLPGGGLFGPAISATDPGGGWIAPTPPNTWISIVGSAGIAPGVYRYTTTFSIDPGYDPATAEISGFWWADEPNAPNGIFLNGVDVSGGFDGAIWFDPDPASADFSIASGFVAGVNTLTFDVENTGGPGGTLIQGLRGTVQPSTVPEGGATIFLLALSLAGVAGLKGNRRQ